MATLIQSKQIEGIVTASIVEGVFQVSGSQIITGSQEVSGDITASNIRVTGKYYGDGSQLSFDGTGLVSGSSQVTISSTSGFTTFSSSIATSIAGITDTDNQTLSFNQVNKRLTISDGNTVDLSSLGGGGGGGGSSIWSTGSSYYYVSSDLQVTGSFSATSLTGSINYSNLTNVPTLISSSAQITAFGFVSESGGSTPAGTISGSEQITSLGFISESVDISQLNSFTSSIQTEVDGISAATSSYLTELPSGVVSGSVLRTLDGTDVISSSAQITAFGFVSESSSVPAGTISGSEQITALGFISSSHTDITQLNSYTSSNDTRLDGIDTVTASFDGRLDNIESATGSYLTSTPAGTVSGSAQITALGFISESGGDLTQLNAYTSSNDTRLDGIDTITASLDSRLDQIESATGSYLTSTPDGTVSGSEQITSFGFISESVDITQLNSYTSSNDTRLDGIDTITASLDGRLDRVELETSSIDSRLDQIEAETGSYLNQNGDDVVSGSVLRTLDGTDVISGSLLPGTNITINSGSDGFFISSSAGGGASVTVSDSAPGSPSEGDLWWKSDDGNLYVYYDGYWVISIDTTNALPTGVLSGSAQITALGFVSESGGDLTHLNTFTSSADSRLDNLEGASGSYLTSVPTGTVSGSEQITDFGFISESFSTDGTGILSGSSQVGALGFISASEVTESIQYNGNRIISQAHLQGFYTSSFNPGTSGSIVDFLNAVFYPNSEPSITTGNITIEEWSGSGAVVQTITGTDPEGQSLTFSTASTYTDDLVRIASNGELTLNAQATSASFNTDLVGGSHGHTFTAQATDTFGSSVTKDITIFVTPNVAPVFRETGIGGNVITNVTVSRNENAGTTLVKRIYFTDAESDAITIESSSISPAGGATHFTVVKYSNYVDITQATASLDYESISQYTLLLSASDSHYQEGDDSDSITELPITISVTDNVQPTISNQTLNSINENSSNGATVDTISASDNETDTITFFNFELHKLELDNVNVASGSYGGTSQATDPHENPFQMSSTGTVTRKNGVHINSDLINEYQYRVQVKDSFNTASNQAIVTIPIDDDTPASLSDNWSAGPYIKESELSGSTIKTTDYGSTQADYGSNQSGTFTSSNPAIVINGSNGTLTLAVDLSGSVTQSGDTIDSTITFTNTFGTTTTDALSVSVVANAAPTATFSNQSSNLNQNLAVTNANLVLVTITDTEGDTPYSASLSGTDASKLNLNYTNSNSSSVYIRANEDLDAGTYTYNFKVTDAYSKSTTYSGRTITIAQPDVGTLGGDTTSYIIESAESGAVLRDATGFNAGNTSQLTVSYSPDYGSQAVASFTSSLENIIAVDNSGNLTLAVDLSGSTTQSTDTITPEITFVDQYGNIGSGSVTVNVFANLAPTATFTNQSANFETDYATTNTTLVSMSISDTESDTPFSASLSGTGASSLKLVYASADSSSVGIQAASNLSAGTYTYNVKVTDSYDKSTTYSGRTITIAQSADYGRVYVYDVGFSNAAYNTAVGITSEDSSTPPVATPFTAIGFLEDIINSGSLGNSSVTYNYGGNRTASRLAEGSGSNLHTVLRGMGSSGTITRNSSNHFVIIFPSGSDMTGIPLTTTDSYGGSTSDEYVLEVGTDGTTIDGSNTLESSEINQFDLASTHLGFDTWFMVGAANQVASSTNFNLGLNPSSGSGGA